MKAAEDVVDIQLESIYKYLPIIGHEIEHKQYWEYVEQNIATKDLEWNQSI